jgi:hypothetical protein
MKNLFVPFFVVAVVMVGCSGKADEAPSQGNAPPCDIVEGKCSGGQLDAIWRCNDVSPGMNCIFYRKAAFGKEPSSIGCEPTDPASTSCKDFVFQCGSSFLGDCSFDVDSVDFTYHP